MSRRRHKAKGHARAMQRSTGRYTPPGRLFVLPSIPDNGPEALKNALAIRNQATRTGVCPGCGNHSDPYPEHPERGTVTIVNFGHADGCPALLEGSG